MTFAHPAGLWFLLGIPLLILLYFLRARHEDQHVSSTFLWQLSVSYQEKHMTSTRLRRMLILAFQILLVLLGSLLIAQPQLSGVGFGKERIVILDTSASMRMTAGGSDATVLDAAKAEVLSLANCVRFGSRVTLLTTDAEDCHLLEQSDSYSEITRALSGVQCSWGEDRPEAAVAVAQEMLRLHPDAEVFYFTDHDIADVDNVTVRNVAPEGLKNAAILSLADRPLPDGMEFTAQVLLGGQAGELTAGLYVDDVLTSAQIISCQQDIPQTVTWRVPGLSAYTSVRMVIEEKDALDEDNAFVLFSQPTQGARVLLVSGQPFYLEHALGSFRGLSCTTYAHAWEAPCEGFDLYIYDRDLPPELPDDGAIWLIDPSAPVAGLTPGESVAGGYLTRNDAVISQRRIAALLDGLSNRDTGVQALREVQETGELVPLLLSGSTPAMLAGFTQEDTPVLVTMFDLHGSNLPLQTDFMVLMQNLLDFALPAALESNRVTVGVPAQAWAVSGCVAAALLDSAGMPVQLEVENGMIPFAAGTPGVHQLVQENARGGMSSTSFFAVIPESESAPGCAPKKSIYLVRPEQGARTGNTEHLDLRLILSALMLLLLTLECVVYNHERI